MKERLKRLPIFDINNGLYPAIDPYPIQPYQMSVNDYTGLPSPLYENIISCYHQVQSIKDRKDDAIYPSKGCAIVCILGNNKARSVLVGSPTIPRIAEYRYPDCVYFVAIFRLDVGYSIFLDFINESIDTHIPLEKIFPAVTPRFTEEMEAAVSFLQRVYIFENFLNQLLTNHTPIPVQHKRLINKISNFSDSSLANATGKLISSEFSSRHVRRLCVRYVGITPKLLARISRYQKTLHILNMNPSINQSDLAMEMGYFDQSHLIKEFKRFQNTTPIEFLSQFTSQ